MVGEDMPGLFSRFVELCRRLGGEVKERDDVVACVVPAAPEELLRKVEDGRAVLETAKALAAASGRRYGLEVYNHGIGGQDDVIGLTVEPDGEVEVFVRLYTDYGREGEAPENAVIVARDYVDHHQVQIEAYPEFNDALDRWFGAAEAYTETKTIDEALDVLPRLIEELEDYAERALDLVVESREE